jgi:hypothetical protein
MSTPQDCAPGDPRLEADLSDLAAWDPEVRFTPDDATKPRGAGVAVDLTSDSEALADHLAMEAETKRQRRLEFSDKQPWFSHAVNFARIPQEVFRSFEKYTNIPFYQMFRRIEDGLDDVELASTDSIKEFRTLAEKLRGSSLVKGNREEKKQVQRLFEARLTDPRSAAELEAKLDPQVVVAADNLHGIYNRYFNAQGMTKEDVDGFLKALPKIRERDGDYLSYHSAERVPKIMASMEDAFKTGEIMLDAREWDFQVIGERLIRAHARQTHLGPAWNLVKAQVDAFHSEGVASEDLFKHFYSYMDEVRYAPDHWQIAMGRTFNKVTEQLLGKKLGPSESFDAVHAFLSTNYYANMAWNTGVALRNFMQPLVTSYPILGERFTWEGYEAAVSAFRGVDRMDRYAKLGVITRDAEPLQASAIRDSMAAGGSKTVGGDRLRDGFNWFRNQGFNWFRSAENTNKIMSYQGMANRATHFGEQFLKGDISWSQFHELSRLDSMDGIAGPISKQIQQLMQGGDVEKASHLMGLQFMRNTQFVYRRGNTPYIMQGTVGHLLGQYGTWPAWYASYMGKMVFQGSFKNRATQLARWTAANSAIVYGAKEVFGVDMARWSFFSPLGYTGGPFVEIGKEAAAAAQVAAGSTDPVDRIQATRLKNGYTQVVPFVPWGGLRNMNEARKAVLNDDWKTATKRFLGFTPVKEGQQ